MGSRLTTVVKYLLIINLGVFVLDQLTAESLNQLLGLRYIGAENFAPWQFVTYMFLHADIMHIFSNMFGLFVFGPWLEQVFDSKKFLLFYMLTGIGAGVLNSGVTYWEMQQQISAIEEYKANPSPEAYLQYFSTYEPMAYRNNADLINDRIDNFNGAASASEIEKLYYDKINSPYSVTVGASGAIFGILIAFAMIFPNLELFLLFFPVPMKAKYLVTFFILYELYAGLNYSGLSNVAHFAHLGGALIGFILIKYWGIKRQY